MFDELKKAGQLFSDTVNAAIMVKKEHWRFRREDGGFCDKIEYRIWSGGVKEGYDFDTAEAALECLRVKTLLHRKVAL